MKQEIKIEGNFEKFNKKVRKQTCSGVVYMNKKYIGRDVLVIIKDKDHEIREDEPDVDDSQYGKEPSVSRVTLEKSE